MTYRLSFIAFYFCLPISIIAQSNDYNKFCEPSIGVGYMEYMNTAAIPSGLPGTIHRLEYRGGKVNKLQTNRLFEFVARADYAYMLRQGLNTDLNIPYYHAEIRLGAVWRQKIPLFIPNITIDVGLGFSFNSLVGYNPSYTYNTIYNRMYPYGNWSVSPDFHFNIKYHLKKFGMKGGFYTPLFVTGFFQEYQNSSYSINSEGTFLNYIISPNTFTLFTNYFRFDGFLSATYLLKNTNKSQLHLKLNYSYESLNSTIHFNSERKQKQMLSIGLVILRI